jgi:glycosyltransferase involved in cell wall biosynthesis
MNHCSLTVVIPTKNEDQTLQKLIKQLLTQTSKPASIVVADTSDTPVVRNICAANDIRCVQGGLPSVGRNAGASLVETKYILFLDADVSVENDFIVKAIESIELKKLDCVNFRFKPDKGSWVLIFLHYLASLFVFIVTKIGFAHGIGGAILVTKKAHEEIGGFDETVLVAEDMDYVKRLARKFRYTVLLNPVVTISTRRFAKVGVWKLAWKCFLIELHRIFLGEIRHDKFKYFQ